MTSEELGKIIARHEMQCLELKESFNVECIETACAFTNAHGGFIVIGVDNGGNPSKHQLRFEGLRDYENKVSTATEPNHPSCPRNKLIAQAFYDIHLIEHYGSGIRRIERECAKNGNAVPKWEQKCGFFVTTYLPRATGQISSNVMAPSDGAINGAVNGAIKLSDVQQRIVDAIKMRPGINAATLATALDLGTSTIDRGVRYLKDLNLIEFRGSRKTGGYYCK